MAAKAGNDVVEGLANDLSYACRTASPALK